jgi:dihydrodipicolinate synthase/N-acetylneuraminate lyase
MSGLLLSKPERRSYFIGDDHASSIAFSAGADGLVSVLANLFPGLMVAWYESHQTRDDSKAKLSALKSQLSPWFDALLGPNPSLIKYCLSEVLGLSSSCRLPLCEPDKELINRLYELVGHDLSVYHKYCPHWEFKTDRE